MKLQNPQYTDIARASEVVRFLLASSRDGLGRTKVYKAFYFAHLFYAEDQPDVLTAWPIVRMPNGPGIGDFDLLIGRLGDEVERSSRRIGPYIEQVFRLKEASDTTLSESAQIAIQRAVEWVQKHSAAELSELTHEQSRSWQTGHDGDTLDIYIDIESDDEYKQREERLRNLKNETESIFAAE